MLRGVADAATLCREGLVPSSKVYLAMEKLTRLGLAQSQPTRPKMFAALPTEALVARTVEIARERADRFASAAVGLSEALAGLGSRVRGRRLTVSLALGWYGALSIQQQNLFMYPLVRSLVTLKNTAQSPTMYPMCSLRTVVMVAAVTVALMH